MSVRYLGSPALHKKTVRSSRGRRPLISVDSACYIAANYRSRRDYYEHHRQGAFRSCSSHAAGTQQRRTLRRVASQTATEEPPLRSSSTPSSASSAEAWRRPIDQDFLSRISPTGTPSIAVSAAHEHKEEKFVNEALRLIKWKEGPQKNGSPRPRAIGAQEAAFFCENCHRISQEFKTNEVIAVRCIFGESSASAQHDWLLPHPPSLVPYCASSALAHLALGWRAGRGPGLRGKKVPIYHLRIEPVAPDLNRARGHGPAATISTLVDAVVRAEAWRSTAGTRARANIRRRNQTRA